jgi:Arc/MetJ-type ribon-helix-helix transcriptional regulator
MITINQMPRIKGKTKKQINYRIPQHLEKKVDLLIENEEFSSQSEIITKALDFYFEHQEIDQIIDIRLKAFFKSEEGKELIKKAIKDEKI